MVTFYQFLYYWEHILNILKDYLNKSDVYLKTETARLEETFDLVMLSDYFFESLVLLGEELCVDHKILFAEERMESAPYEKVELSEKQLKTFK